MPDRKMDQSGSQASRTAIRRPRSRPYVCIWALPASLSRGTCRVPSTVTTFRSGISRACRRDDERRPNSSTARSCARQRANSRRRRLRSRRVSRSCLRVSTRARVSAIKRRAAPGCSDMRRYHSGSLGVRFSFILVLSANAKESCELLVDLHQIVPIPRKSSTTSSRVARSRLPSTMTWSPLVGQSARLPLPSWPTSTRERSRGLRGASHTRRACRGMAVRGMLPARAHPSPSTRHPR